MDTRDKNSGNKLHPILRDVLNIAICGPDCPQQLTFVDLPALINSENESQGSDKVILVLEQVK